MMKNSYILWAFIVPIFWCNAQATTGVENKLFKVNALLPGVSYELGAGKQTTFNFELGLIPESDGVILELFPYLGVDYRYFTNMGRRVNKGKNTAGNSGDYVAFTNRLLFAAPLLGNLEYDTPLLYVGGIVYGIQRTYKKGFYWGVSFGPAFFTGENKPEVGILSDLKIGWVLNRKTK